MADEVAANNTLPPIANPAVEAIVEDAALSTASGLGTPGPATGTITPAMSELPPDQVQFSLKVSLADLCAKGAAFYAHKQYEEAAEVYSQATAMQAEMNGEMSPENAEILFLYGRSLYKVGQSKSDVLGGKAPEKTKDKKPKKAANGDSKAELSASGSTKPKEEEASEAQKVAEEGVAIIAANTTAGKEEDAAIEQKKPLFQFTGDENWDDSDDEEVLQSFSSSCFPALELTV